LNQVSLFRFVGVVAIALFMLIPGRAAAVDPPKNAPARAVELAREIASSRGYRFETDPAFSGLFIVTATVKGEPVRLVGRVRDLNGRRLLSSCRRSSGTVFEEAQRIESDFYSALWPKLLGEMEVEPARSFEDNIAVFEGADAHCRPAS
jgi:hypothetical protein